MFSEDFLRTAFRAAKHVVSICIVLLLFLFLARVDLIVLGIIAAVRVLAVVCVLAAIIAIACWLKLRRIKFSTYGEDTLDKWRGRTWEPGQKRPPALCYGMSEGKLAISEDIPLRPHLLAIASTGAGKTTSLIKPNLAFQTGATLALDVKGEIAANCEPLINQGRKVYAYVPEPTMEYHPDQLVAVNLDLISCWHQLIRGGTAFAEFCAEQIFCEMGEPAFDENAKILGGAMIAYCLDRSQGPDVDFFKRLHMLARKPKAEIKATLKKYPNLKDAELRMIAESGYTLVIETNERLLDSVLPGMRRQLKFILSRSIVKSLSGGYDISRLLEPGCSDVLFIVVPPSRLKFYRRVLNLIFGTVGMMVEGIEPYAPANLLVAMDEASALGRADWLREGLARHRGAGIAYLLAFQSLAQIEEHYGKTGLDDFMGNCASIYFGLNDLETAQRVSALAGKKTALAKSQEGGLGVDVQKREVELDAINPAQARGMDKEKIFLLTPSHPACVLKRIALSMLKMLLKKEK